MDIYDLLSKVSFDSEILGSLSITYGSRLESLSRRQRLSLAALSVAMLGGENSPDILPEEMITLISGLSELGWLSLLQSLVEQLKADSQSLK